MNTQQEKAESRSIALGVFFLCMSLLSFEIFSTRILSVVVGPHLIYSVIALAMLGMSTSLSVLSVQPKNFAAGRLRQVLGGLSLLLGLIVIGVLGLVKVVNQHFNVRETEAFAAGGFETYMQIIVSNYFPEMLLVSILLAIPYFIFGVAIGALFRTISDKSYSFIYFSDLVGSAIGALLIVAALSWGGFQAALFIVCVPFFVACFFFSSSVLTKAFSLVCCLGVTFLLTCSSHWSLLEPTPEEVRYMRKFKFNRDGEEIWRRWDGYTRVGLVEFGKESKYFSLGNGDGWAQVVPYRSGLQEGRSVGGRRQLASLFQPERILVLMAGVGKDMVMLDRECAGQCDITGVELNRQMVEKARLHPEWGLQKFFEKPHIHLHTAEGREFIERDTSKYDTIFLSWSGASTSYYTGTAGHSTQYLYTKEAIAAYFDHLTSRGVVIFVNQNKARLLAAIRLIFEERGLSGLDQAIVVALPRAEGGSLPDWRYPWDALMLFVKPSGFTGEDINTLKKQNYEVLIAPGFTHDDYQIYRKIIAAPVLQDVLNEVVEQDGLELGAATDDRPFILDMTPRMDFLQPWKTREERPERELLEASILATQLLGKSIAKNTLYSVLYLVALLSLPLILLPVIIRSQIKLTWHSTNHLAYFFCVGAGFMFIEVGLIQKLSLLLGEPSLAIAVVLAAIILWSGIGSFFSEKLFQKKIFNFRRVVVLLVVVTALFLFFYSWVLSSLLGYPVILKVLFIMLGLFPFGFLMGQLFPQGLKRVRHESEQLVPWAWAINGVSSVLAVCASLLLAIPLGFSALVMIGAGWYLLILLLPEYSRSSSA